MKKDIEHINPMRMTDTETGEVYELDFDHAAVVYAERKGFKISDVGDFSASMVPLLFEYSFRKNHMNIAKSKINELFKKKGGLTFAEIGRLTELYYRALMSNTIIMEEDAEKNGVMTVEL